ncbi:MAG: nucleotidyltransferase [Candidatus Omnitrophica bacterium]|nr:nucleotidyltransferase [Candidatus Omnitrophota bacterium]
MNFEAVLKLLVENFQKHNIRFALIGGFALQASGYTRASEDIDFLSAKEDMPKVKGILLAHGYEAIHESEDVSTFVSRLSQLGRVDFLHAHRKYTRAMLERAVERNVFGGRIRIKVVTPEDLIGLKVQSSSNDPARYHRDMADIEELMKAHRGKLDVTLLKEYFGLFGRQKELEKLLDGTGDVE